MTPSSPSLAPSPPSLRALQRQLDASQRGDGMKVSFDPGEWSRNACFLADYYSGLGRFPEAGRCLLAAQVKGVLCFSLKCLSNVITTVLKRLE